MTKRKSYISDKEREKFNKEILKIITKSAFIDGLLNLEDLKDPKKTIFVLKNIVDGEIHFKTDHSDDLLENAKKFAKKRENYSILLYAIYFEHLLNEVILHQCFKRKIVYKTASEIIRNVNLNGKLGWLLEVCGLPKIFEKHKNLILKIAEERNSFVHYKHKPLREEEEAKINLERKKLVKEIDKSVIYMKKYRSKVLYGKKKKYVDSQISKLFK